jgi:NAD dependent epimerase/dehydratase family enzyme
MGDALLLSSTRVSSEKLQQSGYRFEFPDLESALRGVIG